MCFQPRAMWSRRNVQFEPMQFVDISARTPRIPDLPCSGPSYGNIIGKGCRERFEARVSSGDVAEKVDDREKYREPRGESVYPKASSGRFRLHCAGGRVWFSAIPPFATTQQETIRGGSFRCCCAAVAGRRTRTPQDYAATGHYLTFVQSSPKLGLCPGLGL